MSRGERGVTGAGTTRPKVAEPSLTWRTPLRAVLRYGLPFAGVAVIMYYVVASVGGDISRIGFAAGVVLILASACARLVEGR